MANILVTGGAGYIGSHTVIELIEAGHNVTVVDSLINSSAESIHRAEQITGTSIDVHLFDVRDQTQLDTLFSEHDFDAVVHFAGLKAVGESVEKPLLYYKNNLDSTLILLDTMQAHGVKKLIFSSSATVYGTPQELPLTETSPVGHSITNPYGWTKYMIEQILDGIATANADMEITILRYFNPIGAHVSGLIGEDPKGIPNNLVPYVAQTAAGLRDSVRIWGDDYDTPDGTGVRDYIHVVDLAKGHVAALNHSQKGVETYNLGTGHGYSVLDVIKAFSLACGHDIPYDIQPRRPGDIASCYADATKAAEKLGWKAEKSLDDMCRDAWRWQSANPNGYKGVE